MSADDRLWPEDPLPVGRDENAGRCLQCWREVYGSFPNKPLCREHFMDEQQRAIAALVASRERRAS